MSIIGDSMFLLEVIINKVLFTDLNEETNTCPLCVCFKFPLLTDINLCEGDFCGGSYKKFSKGVMSIFSITAQDLCSVARQFGASITVYRSVTADNTVRLVALTKADFDESFSHLIQNPNDAKKFRESKQELPLFENERNNKIGTIDVIFRLTSLGSLLVTEYYKKSVDENYLYKAGDECVPAILPPINACPVKKKHCRHCKSKKTSSKNLKCSGGCDRTMNKIMCAITTMEMIMKMFKAAKATPKILATNSNKLGKIPQKSPINTGRCLFDPECIIFDCPFKTNEPEEAMINRIITNCNDQQVNNKHGGNHTVRHSESNAHAQHPKVSEKTSEVIEPVVDDEDLFVVSVGRVDHCRLKVTKDDTTQYQEGDVPLEWLQEITNQETPKEISKSNKSKANKKTKKKKKK
ncbi:uncharacterized protein LOC126899668 [Daktulosphaira vitifoliae]|uniref:uncharacterized protein LOC126899668 n=1 Tax=Daktulosphaira vitifoliae TaxID=58002 RepID=UPI0021A9E8CC|nr:uncharacterized protein LOC126899668 [Daktulosphaira vitifoliae]